MIAGAFFGNSGWVATSCYFVGIAAIICSGIILKKTKMFAGDPAPFVMELPAYHWPTVSNILRSMWERGWSFIKKAGTIILLSTIILWFLMSFGWEGGSFGMVEELNESILSKIGTAIAWIFCTSWLDKSRRRMEDGSCSCYRSDRKRECSSYIWYALWIRRSCRRRC